MSEPDPDIEAELAALRADFRTRLREDLAAFVEAQHRGAAADPAALTQRAHRLAGAAGSFGETALSEAAARFERAAGSEKAEIDIALRDLVAALGRAVEDDQPEAG